MGFFRIMFRWFFSMKQDSCVSDERIPQNTEDPTKNTEILPCWDMLSLNYMMCSGQVNTLWPSPPPFFKGVSKQTQFCQLTYIELWVLMKPIELIPVVFVLILIADFICWVLYWTPGIKQTYVHYSDWTFITNSNTVRQDAFAFSPLNQFRHVVLWLESRTLMLNASKLTWVLGY